LQSLTAKYLFFLAVFLLAWASPPAPAAEEFLKTTGEVGVYGGRLVVAQRAEPKTLNPVTAVDNPSRDVIRRLMADLIHISRQTFRTEPALAQSWTATQDGRRYVVHLRRGLRFSDGHAFDADDVVFSFRVYLDEKEHSPQRDLLIVGGKPIEVTKLDQYTVRFEFAEPYAAADRLFDSVVILPRHLLEATYREGKLAQAWNLNSPPDQIAGLGPFRLKKYIPGERITLERNPYYWKSDAKGQRLPYLDEIIFLFVSSDDVQVLRFQAGETDVISRLSAENYGTLLKDQQAHGYTLYDLGPGLEYNYVFFNLNDDTGGRLPEVARKQAWFRDLRFRQAVSAAIDREAIVRLVFQGRAAPLWSQVTPGNRLWVDSELPKPARSIDRARELLRLAGFSWKGGALVDSSGKPVEFTIITSASNNQRRQMATLIQDDLKQLGMQVQVVPLEFRAQLDRIFQTHDYESSLMALGSGDLDPTADMNVWLSSGGTHVWHLGQKQPATPWEAEIDSLMRKQLVTLDYKQRKRLYDRVQALVGENLPIICLASPNILVGAKNGLGNFHPSILDHYTLSNVDEMFWRRK
jgi:peptide/nickel transport system substrate-binding protein